RGLEVLVDHDARVVHQHVQFGKIRLHARSQGSDLHGIRDVALDCVELRAVRFHLVEHSLAPASDDDLVAEFEELEGESTADAGGTAGDEDSATFEIHKIPFMSVVRGNAFSFWRNGSFSP